MRKSKNIGMLCLAGVLALGILGGCSAGAGASAGVSSREGKTADGGGSEGASGGAKKFVAGYCNGADSDVFMVARKTALIDKINSEHANIELEFADANQDSTKQLGDADTFIAKKVDLLILVPNDAEAIVPAVEEANKAGIPVICLGIKAASGDYIYVGSQNYDAGHMQGELLAKTLPEDGTVLYLAGTAGMQHSTDRRQGFLDALKEGGRDDIRIVADLDGNYEMAKAMQITEDWIQKYPHFDAIVAANDQMALGAVEALKGANRLEGVQITGVDGIKEALEAIKAKEMVQTILQDAPGQAEAAYKVIEQLMAGESPEKEVLVPFQSVTADNVQEYAS